MPATMIQATQEWWTNWQAVMDTAIDTCTGMAGQITNHQWYGQTDAEELLDQLNDQLRQLRRQLEAVRIPF